MNNTKEVETIKTKKILIADFSLLLVAMVWGGGFVVTKNLLNQMGPFYFLGIRFTVSALILSIIFWKKVKKIDINCFKKGSIIGSALFLGFATQTVGLLYTTPAKQSFITGTNVIIVPFLYMLVTGEKVEKQSIIGAALASIGLSVISFQEGVLLFNLGDVLTLFCAFFFAAHIVSIGVLVKEADPISLTIIQLALTGVISLLIAVFKEPAPLLTLNEGFVGMSYMILLSSIGAFMVQNIAQTFTFSTHAAIILCLESVFGALFSWMFWGEDITVKFVIGAAVILAGIIVTEVKIGKKEELPV